MKKINFSSITEFLVLSVAFLLPVFFTPLTTDLFDFNKRILFLLASLFLVLALAIKTLITRELKLTRNPWTLAVTLFGLATLATIFVISPNKINSLLSNGGMYLSFVIFFLTGISLVKKGFTSKLVSVLSFSAVVLTIVSLVDRFGFSVTGALNNLFGLNIPQGTRFFMTGSPLFTVFFLSIVGAMLLARFMKGRTSQNGFVSILFAVVCLVGLLINGEALLPGQATHPQFLGVLDSWSIATDVLKTPLNAAFGVGTDSYANAFSIFKPLKLNQTPLWFVRFNNGRDSILELLVTQGIVSVLFWLAILFVSLRLIKTARGEDLPLAVGTLLTIGLLLFFPPNIILVSLLCILLLAWGASLKEQGIRTTESTFSLFAYFDGGTGATKATQAPMLVSQLIGVLAIIAVVAGLYGLGRAYAAEYWFNRSILAAAKGNGKDTYDFAIKSISANPYMENYHRAFALTNLALAQGISQRKDISDTDKQTVLTLVQQAIQQAKIAVSLDTLDTANWDNLTQVYQTLIGSVQGADQWTIASFVEQIKTDPANPQVRFNLGSVYRQLGNDDMALQLFQQAVQLKPDFANAYYNMADIYKKRSDKVNEAAMLQAVLQYIKPEQSGYQTVKSRFDELQGQSSGSNTPTPKPTPTPTPSVTNVTLPENAGPTPGETTVPQLPQ